MTSPSIFVDAPGYSGKSRDERVRRWNDRYGEGQWRLAHQYRGQVLDLDQALELYGAAYIEHFRRFPEVLDALVREAADVYDTSPTNVESGLDWHRQEGAANHLQDIAVRRAVAALGRRFEGQALIEIRGHRSAGYHLNPGQVPFHEPEAICQFRVFEPDWVLRGSVEDFWQNNKVMLATPEGVAKLEAGLDAEVAQWRRRERDKLMGWLRSTWLAGRWAVRFPAEALALVHPTAKGTEANASLREDDWTNWLRDAVPLLDVASALHPEPAWAWDRLRELVPVLERARELTLFPAVQTAARAGIIGVLERARELTLCPRLYGDHLVRNGAPLTRALLAALHFRGIGMPEGTWPVSSNTERKWACWALARDTEVHAIWARPEARAWLQTQILDDVNARTAVESWRRLLEHPASSDFGRAFGL